MLDWHQIRTVFLDLDGTLLDLHFDNHFWREHVPLRYAQRLGIDVDTAKAELYSRYGRVEGRMEWYCVDYWSRELELDIALLKAEVEHLIAIHPHVPDFLDALRAVGKRVLLVTNAHHKSLALKMERTRLAGHFDAVVCSHDFGCPKEDVRFWDALQGQAPFDPAQTLLIDDSLAVLRSARAYGIGHLLAVCQPDTSAAPREIDEFPAIESFRQIMPGRDGKSER
jgi:5'-nucleotidase